VPQEQSFNVFKLKNRKISSQCGLFTLLANNTYPNISSLDHADIITAIANAQHSTFLIFGLVILNPFG
jgi:hypothetical protein